MNELRTDLAIEARDMCEKAEENHLEGINVTEYEKNGVYVTAIDVLNENGSKILGKAVGRYITIDAPDIQYSKEVYKAACIELSEQIKKIYKITDSTKTLVVGLGNKLITPDALGPETVSRLVVTNHIKDRLNEEETAFSGVCAIVPGVLGTTGIETTDIIKGVVDRIEPDLVIAVDALASRSIDRISTTVQISDAGIIPGSGVNNSREGITEGFLKRKVIAIGVPTVVDAATVALDSFDLLGNKFFKYDKENRNLAYEELMKNMGNMVVTPKDIDLVIERSSKTVANGINLALHKNITFDEIESYVGSY